MRNSIIAGLMAAVITIMLVLYFIPPVDDFNPDNLGWNGLSDLSSDLHLKRVKNLLGENLLLNPSNTTLLIIGPEEEFTEAEARVIRSFLEAGGSVILADDFGSGNSLLQLLGINVRFSGSLLVDPLFKERSMRFPRIRSLSKDMESIGVEELVFNYATVIEGCVRPIGFSSYYSFLDLNLNGVWDKGEPKGPFAVACMVSIGRGRLFILSDPSIVINSMLPFGDNLGFIKALVGSRTVYLDESHWRPSLLAQAKDSLMVMVRFMSLPEIRYTMLVGVVFVIFRYRRVVKPRESEVEKVLMRNPTWDRELLVRLEREMRRER